MFCSFSSQNLYMYGWGGGETQKIPTDTHFHMVKKEENAKLEAYEDGG